MATPPSTYGGAADSPGGWTIVEFMPNSTSVVNLFNGCPNQSTPTVRTTGPTGGVPGCNLDRTCPTNPGPCAGFGPNELALYDGIVATDPMTFIFEGVREGIYQLFVYASWDSSFPGTSVNVVGSPSTFLASQCPSGTDAHGLGITYVAIPVAVDASGRFDIVVANAVPNTGYVVSGFQLRRVEVGSNYCVAAANSVSPMGTRIRATATRTPCVDGPSEAANDMTLFAYPVPDAQPGRFLYGFTQLQIPFGEGFRCVSMPTRLGVVYPQAGTSQYDLDLSAPAQDEMPILAGQTLYLQFWYRDPAGGGSGFNLSDALEVMVGS